MGFILLDRPNPNGRHFYPTRNAPLLAIVVHGTAGAEDLDTFSDLSAENVAHYAATTDRLVSWHTGSDADSWVDLLPSSYTAWHATDYNSCTHGHEISKRHMDWRGMPEAWISKTLRMAALGPDGNSGLRKIAVDNGIPLRWATRAELDAQIANYRAGRPWQRVGFITHHEVQPADRTDPGYVHESGRLVDTFPRERFMALLNKNLEDDMPSHITLYDGREVTFNDWAKHVYGTAGDLHDMFMFPQVDSASGAYKLSGKDLLVYVDHNGIKLDRVIALLAVLAKNDDVTVEELERIARESAAESGRQVGEVVAQKVNSTIAGLVEQALEKVQGADNEQEVTELLQRIGSLVPQEVTN